MARIRTIKPDFFTSDDVCSLKPLARLLYIGLWCEADREGRMVWSPKAFKRRYLPEDKCDVEELCVELVNRGLVLPYGSGLAFIPTFAKHQYVNPREAQSVLPDPGGTHAHMPVSDASVTHRGEGREGKERKESLPPSRKTKLPDDWQLTPELAEYANAQGCADPVDTAERFKLHHQSKGTLAADWDKAFQYWCRNERNFRRPDALKTNGREPARTIQHDTAEQWRARMRGYEPGGFWHEADWGPRPESRESRVPFAILDELGCGYAYPLRLAPEISPPDSLVPMAGVPIPKLRKIAG